MLLRNNLFYFSKPEDFKNLSTSRLMKGLVFDFNNPYIPFFTPIGTSLLNNIEGIFKLNANESNCYEVQIPQIMDTELLRKGQEIGRCSKEKIVHLSGGMSQYHLITSPEIMFMNILSKNNIDSNAFPINYYFISNLFRDMPDPKHILRTKQLRVFAGVSMDKSSIERQSTENNLVNMLRKSFIDFRFPFHEEPGGSGFSYEYFYMHSKETENYVIPSIDKEKKTKALSFGMIYDYSQECPYDLMHINPYKGKKEKTFITSYAISTQRVLYIIMDYFRDDKGFNLPAKIRPCDIVMFANEQNMEYIKKIALDLSKNNINIYIDNVFGRAHNKRMDNADYIGAGLKIVNRGEKLAIFNRAGECYIQTTDTEQVVKYAIDIINKQKSI